ncbi:MAG: response regulator [Campylobacterota bacterium]|nr:response regulator [Campylobacterota bacterium]
MKNQINYSILYVEDNQDIVEEISFFLEGFVDKLYVAENGKEGLAKFKEFKPDIVITDIQMPIMDGIEMMKAIREIDSNTPIIVTTAFNDSDYLIQAIKLHTAHYLMKPLNLKKLKKSIDEVYEPIELKKQLLEKNRELEELNRTLEAKVEQKVAEVKEKERIIMQQAKLAAMGEMVGTIAHQWRQPLDYLSIMITNHILDHQKDKITQESMDTFTQKTNSVIQMMSTTIDDFRSFFLPNKEKKIFTLREVIDGAVYLIEDIYGYSNITLVDTINENITLKAYKNELIQVLLSLLNNAKDAIQSRGIDEGRVVISMQSSQTNMTLSIRDNGGGIDERIIDRVFDPYFTTKFKDQGRGVGLYMSKMIIEQSLGGTLKIKNMDKGVEVSIRLKIDRSHQAYPQKR